MGFHEYQTFFSTQVYQKSRITIPWIFIGQIRTIHTDADSRTSYGRYIFRNETKGTIELFS